MTFGPMEADDPHDSTRDVPSGSVLEIVARLPPEWNVWLG